jgi:hypothetical protein
MLWLNASVKVAEVALLVLALGAKVLTVGAKL